MAQSGRLAGSVAIVTAGGQGIGEAIAKTFAREGASVAVVDINRAEAERVAREIKAAEGDALRARDRRDLHRVCIIQK